MSMDDNFSDYFLINYIESVPKNFASYYLESKMVSGFSANILDEIQDLLKQIGFLENVMAEIKELAVKESLVTRRRIKKIEGYKLEVEELRDMVRINEDLQVEYKKMLERENESKNTLCSKLFEKEKEIDEFIELIEELKCKLASSEQNRKFQVSQYKDSLITLEPASQRSMSSSNENELSSPLMRKFTKDIDVLCQEKESLEESLRIKTDDYETLEKKYLKLLRRNEALTKQIQQQEVHILESNQEILSLKSKLKSLKSSLNFANKKIFAKVERPPPINRKTKSMLTQPNIRTFKTGKAREFFVDVPFFESKRTLMEEMVGFPSPQVSNYQLDFGLDDKISEHSNQSHSGHMHQESFGLQQVQIKDIQIETINIEDTNIEESKAGEESPKFPRSDNMSIHSTSTIEVETPNKNPHPRSHCSNDECNMTPPAYYPQNYQKSERNSARASMSANCNAHNNEKTITVVLNKRIDSQTETRKKLIEIEKKGPCVTRDGEEKKGALKGPETDQGKRISKVENFMRITLNMIPSGTFWTKIMDLGEDILKK